MQDLFGTRGRSPEPGMCSHSGLCNTRTKDPATHGVGTDSLDTACNSRTWLLTGVRGSSRIDPKKMYSRD